MIQLELFKRDEKEYLFPYWRESLRRWVCDVYQWRGYPYTTGWSMACQGYMFARLLYSHGQLSRSELRRYFRFDRRVQRWDRNKLPVEKYLRRNP